MTPKELAAAEFQVFTTLAQLKQEMLEIGRFSGRSQYQELAAHYDSQLRVLSQKHRANKKQRDKQRCSRGAASPSHAKRSLTGESLTSYLLTLQHESQQDGMEKRRLKQERDAALLPLEKAIARTEKQLQQLKQQYKTISADWQTHIQQAYLATLAETDRAAISLLCRLRR